MDDSIIELLKVNGRYNGARQIVEALRGHVNADVMLRVWTEFRARNPIQGESPDLAMLALVQPANSTPA